MDMGKIMCHLKPKERIMDEFSVSSELNEGVSIVTVTGRVDSVTAAALDTELAKIVSTHKQIVLNLKGVDYLSSAGVRAVVRALRNAEKSGGGVKLANIPNVVAEVLETVGMMQALEVYPTVDEAVAGF